MNPMIDRQWLAKCATAGEFLYGLYTVTVLKKMYEKRKGCRIQADDLISTMKDLEETGEVLMEYVPGILDEVDVEALGFFVPVACEGTALEDGMRKADQEGNPYASLHLDEKERIDLAADTPSDLEYYIPSASEIDQLVDKGYIGSPEMAKLEYQVRKHSGDPEGLKVLWAQISTDKLDQMEAVNAVLNVVFPGAPAMEELKSVMPYVNDFINNVNCRARKGWKPHELFKKMHPNGLTETPTLMPGSVQAAKAFKGAESRLKAMGVNVDDSSIDSFVTTGAYGERRVTKVGRNDPCPCGSGKKYKRCHGR